MCFGFNIFVVSLQRRNILATYGGYLERGLPCFFLWRLFGVRLELSHVDLVVVEHYGVLTPPLLFARFAGFGASFLEKILK